MRCKYCHNRDTWDINSGNYISIDDLMDKISRYKNFIMPTGGVTITGGEPLLQARFLISLFKRLKEEGIHTAIDTSGIVKLNDDVKELLRLTDLVLLDIKHINDEKCESLVGLSNKLELKFAKYLSDNNIPIWIRYVLVPGITDDKEDLLELKQFISSLKTIEKVELLPYHSMGKYKWKDLGEVYELEDIQDSSEDDVKKAKEILRI